MKVTDSAITDASTARVGGTATSAVGTGGVRKGPSASEGGDRVDISTLSGRLLHTLSQTDGPERAAHVERLAAVVRSGQYRPDSMAISRKIIDDAVGSLS